MLVALRSISGRAWNLPSCWLIWALCLHGTGYGSFTNGLQWIFVASLRNYLAVLHERIWIKKAASAQCMMWSSILIHTKCQQIMLSKRCCMTPHWKVCLRHCLAAHFAGLIDLLSYNMAGRCIVHQRTKMFLLYGNSKWGVALIIKNILHHVCFLCKLWMMQEWSKHSSY